MTALSIYFLSTIFIILQPSYSQKETQWKAQRLIRKDDWSLQVTRRTKDRPMFIYVLCEDEPFVDSGRECMIVQHMNISSDTEKPKECKFTLENATRGIVYVQVLGNDNAIFAWAGENKKTIIFNTAVIKMSTCQIFNIELPLSTKSPDFSVGFWFSLCTNIIAYETTFDLSIQGIQACGDTVDDNHCIYTYNSDGKLISGPVTIFSPHFDEENYELQPILPNSSNKSYVLVAGHHARQISIIKPMEDKTVMTKMISNLPPFVNKKSHALTVHSQNNGLIGMCRCQVLSDKVSCSCLQFDEGNSKKQMQITLRNPSNTRLFMATIYNLREGGFYFIALYTDDKKYLYTLYKVNTDGRVVGDFKVISSHMNTCKPEFVNTRLIEQNDGQYCITLMCIESIKDDNILKTLRKCYTPSSLE